MNIVGSVVARAIPFLVEKVVDYISNLLTGIEYANFDEPEIADLFKNKNLHLE